MFITILQMPTVYALNGLWGRFDQTLANINTLYHTITLMEQQPFDLYLVSEDSILLCLQPVRKTCKLLLLFLFYNIYFRVTI